MGEVRKHRLPEMENLGKVGSYESQTEIGLHAPWGSYYVGWNWGGIYCLPALDCTKQRRV